MSVSQIQKVQVGDSIEIHKLCPSCKRFLPLCDYNYSGCTKYKVQTSCRNCQNSKKRAKRAIKTQERLAAEALRPKTKTCCTCKEEKEPEAFPINKNGKYGRHSKCRECLKVASKRNYVENIDRLRDLHKKYSQNNKQSLRAYNRGYEKERRKNDPNYRLRKNLRARIAAHVVGKAKTGSAVRDLGCTVDELKIYLESLFWPGMAWENHSRKGWVVDHIIPLVSFDLTDREQFLKACHYTNLQPLWDHDNEIKHDRLDWTPAESKHELPERLKEQYGRKVA